MPSQHPSRAFKTARFAKDAKKSKIRDDELCQAIKQVQRGQADDLGGSVYKKRLNDNLHRSIILAKSYAGLTEHQLALLLANQDFVEICHDD